MMTRRCSVLLLVLAAIAASSATATAGALGAERLSPRPHPRMLGAIPSAYAGRHATKRAGAQSTGSGPLEYHGGPVMHTNTTHAIYWGTPGPLMTPMYQGLINGYLANVAAASGARDNVYATDTQYYDGSGHIQYASTYAGSYIDSVTPIPDHCSSAYAGTRITVHSCVTDADIQAEVARVAAAQGWTPGPGTMFLVFTPKDVGSCFDVAHGTCAYSAYCAYHSNFVDSQSRDVIYTAEPHPDTSDPAGINSPGVCDRGQHPNGDVGDAAINLASHEHNEAITDPNGDAWSDSSGNENADKCAWMFDTPLGTTGLGNYNQMIATGRYYVQQEWSNADGGCRLGMA
jgi:hypothetical protein